MRAVRRALDRAVGRVTGSNDQEPALVDWALAYAARGLAVLPLVPDTQKSRESGRFCSCIPGGSGPPIGSTDQDWIRRRWAAQPRHNVGVITGERNRLLVLDVDAKGGRSGFGDLSVWRYERQQEGLELPPTLTVSTPSGGRHIWYRLPGGLHVHSNPRWLHGVEVKACGNQVAAPRSVRTVQVDEGGFLVEDVRCYTWDEGVAGVEGIAVAPAWLLEDVARRRDGRGSGANGQTPGGGSGGDGSGDGVDGDKLPATDEFLKRGLGWFTGSRNTDAFRLACRLWLQLGVTNEIQVLDLVERAWAATPDRSGSSWYEIKQAALSAQGRMRRSRDAELEEINRVMAEYVRARMRRGERR